MENMVDPLGVKFFYEFVNFFELYKKLNYFKKKTYSLGIMKLFSFKAQMRQLIFF